MDKRSVKILVAFSAVLALGFVVFVRRANDRHNQPPHSGAPVRMGGTQPTTTEAPTVTIALPIPAIEAAPTKASKDSGLPIEERIAAALKARNRDLAKLYALNAINRSPGDVSAIWAYARLANEGGDVDELDRAIAIVEAAAYHVSPEQMEATISLRGKLTARRDSVTAAPVKQRMPVDWAKRLTDLEKADLDVLLASDDSLTDHVNDLTEVKSLLAGSDNPDTVALAARAQRQIDRCMNAQAATRTLEYLRQCCARLRAETDPNSERAMSVASSAEAAMAQLWGLPEEDLTPALSKRAKDAPTMLRAEVDRILIVRANKALAAIIECVRAANTDPPKDFIPGNEIGPETRRLRWVLELNRRALVSAPIPSVPAGEASPELRASLEQIRLKSDQLAQRLRDLQQAQYDAYQKWAISVIKEASSKCENVYWTTRKADPRGLSNNDLAKKHYLETDVFRIDPNLLCPEVSSIYADVRGRLFSHMDPATTVDLSEQTNLKKRPLEEF